MGTWGMCGVHGVMYALMQDQGEDPRQIGLHAVHLKSELLCTMQVAALRPEDRQVPIVLAKVHYKQGNVYQAINTLEHYLEQHAGGQCLRPEAGIVLG